MNWNEGIREVSNISKEEKDKIFNESLAKQKPYVEPPAVKIGLKEVWVLKDDCGHEPYMFADRETPYEYIKKDLTKTINYINNKTEKDEYDDDYIKELNNNLAELDESYAEGGDFGIDGMWYCHCYKIYQKGEMPD